jgi:hypothetical protein
MTNETPKRPAEAPARREERESIEHAVNALDDQDDGQRPEALSQFAESARDGEEAPKDLTADRQTMPRPTANKTKHKVATRILHDGAKGEHPDPQAEGVDQLPDRIIDRG